MLMWQARRAGWQFWREGAEVPNVTGNGSRKMVFHAPFPVREGETSASGIRPWKMLCAFKEAGYQVFQVTGYAAERRRRFASLKRGMANGWTPDFVYSEAATIPSSFTERKHVPLILNLERQFFRFIHKQSIPSGVFYRDVYWAFEDYVKSVGKPVAAAMRILYAREIETFNRYVDVVFLPTAQMGAHIPGLEGPRLVALPPGCEVGATKTRPRPGKLRLLYVGAVGGHHYDISALLEAVEDTQGVELTICTRLDQWESAVQADQRLLSSRVHVVHESGPGLEPLYEDADVACLVMKPQEYRSFAAPMKLYEYLGHGKPVLVSEGTHAADVVEGTGAGWVVPFESHALVSRLNLLAHDPDEVEKATSAAVEAGFSNTWQERVKVVGDALRSGEGTGRGSEGLRDASLLNVAEAPVRTTYLTEHVRHQNEQVKK